MGGAPPPPLGAAPQGGKKGTFFPPEDQGPRGGEGGAPATTQARGQDRRARARDRVRSRAGGGPRARKSFRSVGEQDLRDGDNAPGVVRAAFYPRQQICRAGEGPAFAVKELATRTVTLSGHRSYRVRLPTPSQAGPHRPSLPSTRRVGGPKRGCPAGTSRAEGLRLRPSRDKLMPASECKGGPRSTRSRSPDRRSMRPGGISEEGVSAPSRKSRAAGAHERRSARPL